jgi:hypothetical protein
MKHEDIDHTGLTGVGGLSDPMTTRGDIIIRNASNVTARLARGSSGQVLRSDGTDVAWATPSAGSGAGTILATNVYAPGSPATMTQTSGTMADADATNMKVTATTAATCIVRLSGCFRATSGATGGDRGYWGIRIGSSTPTGGGPSFMFMAQGTLSGNLLQMVAVDFYLSGLTPGSNIFKWGIAGGGSAAMGVYADASNPAIMTVIST